MSGVVTCWFCGEGGRVFYVRGSVCLGPTGERAVICCDCIDLAATATARDRRAAKEEVAEAESLEDKLVAMTNANTARIEITTSTEPQPPPFIQT